MAAGIIAVVLGSKIQTVSFVQIIIQAQADIGPAVIARIIAQGIEEITRIGIEVLAVTVTVAAVFVVPETRRKIKREFILPVGQVTAHARFTPFRNSR